MLSDKTVIVTSGETDCDECDEMVQEIYDPSADAWTKLSSAPFFFPYYPHVFLLPDGRLCVPADAEAPIVSEVLDLKTLAWTAIGGTKVDGGSTVMYLPAKFLKLGTSVNPDLAIRPSVATAYVLDMTQTSSKLATSGLNGFRSHLSKRNFTTRCTVLVTGGGITTNAVGIAPSNAVLAQSYGRLSLKPGRR